MNDFYIKNNSIYNIFIVYINEAHAADIWNIGESAGSINYSHKTLSDRIGYAKKLKEEFKLVIPIYCDNMKDEFETMFAGWPVRYFVSLGKEIQLISEPDNSELDLCKLFEFLTSS